MNFEDLKVIWDTDNERPAFTLDEEALGRTVVRRAEKFRRQIFWRNWREIGVALVLVVVFLWQGITSTGKAGGEVSLLSWSHFITALACAFVAGFIRISGQRQNAREANGADSIDGNLRMLSSHLSLQIRLLNNVGWWYLLPLLPGGILFIAATSDDGVEFWGRSVFVLLLFGGILWLNLWVAGKHLVPQRREVDSLLAALENNGERIDPAIPSSRPEPESPILGTFRFLLVAFILACVGWLVFFVLFPFADPREAEFREAAGWSKPASEFGYAKVAPFSGVRWEGERPIVRVGKDWRRLVSIDGIPIVRIMGFAREEFGDRARKRFGEDLPELLSKMGHSPAWEVNLELATDDGATESLKTRMTRRSRDLVRDQGSE